MKIGILKEHADSRVAMLPETVAALKKLKVEVIMEKGAGEGAFAPDEAYTEAGAEILGRSEVVKQADVLVQITPPSDDEMKNLREGQALISMLNPLGEPDRVKALRDWGVTAFSLELIPRISRAQAMDVLSSMATVAGYKAVLEAANTLPTFFPMFMSAAGTIKPAKVLILGAGVAGLQAIAIARKLGAVVEVFDVRSAVKEEVKSLGGKFIEVEGAVEDAAAGGYAVEQTEEFKQKQQQMIQDHAADANVVIATAQIPGRKAPVLVKKETVERMKPGSVIIDLAASSGGNCEMTQNNRIISHNNVTIVGKSNYPAEMPADASKMFGRNLLNFLKLIIDEEGGMNLDFEDEIVKGTCLVHQKEIVNERVKSIIKP
ncbi:MAG: Re/Si-specific NAD(P)(+) transhydrogenase subunit alpha [Chlorobi bacterium]|nr:Re/Si-specific NAD(P)(+) transhydrogenase subunit alpha [Chlorobiota bacterium]